MVEDTGVEPVTQPCKGRVFPTILIPQKNPLVPQGRFELPRLSALRPKRSVSTIPPPGQQINQSILVVYITTHYLSNIYASNLPTQSEV